MTTTAASLDTLTGSYRIDQAHSRLGFVARHAMVTKVRGTFDDFDGSGSFDAEHPERSHLEVTIKAASINTRNADRDAHLRGNDFFSMDEYPEIVFRSTALEQAGPTAYRLAGDLTMKGTTKPVTFDLEFTGAAVDPFGNQRIGLEGTANVNRKDWGVSWNAPLEAGGVLVSERITIELEVSAIRVDEVASAS